MNEEPRQLDLWAEAQPPCPSPSELVLLRRVDAEANMRRFYQLDMARSLFGQWGVVRQWGRIGARGRSLTEWHEAPETARAALTRMVGRKRRRGYRPLD